MGSHRKSNYFTFSKEPSFGEDATSQDYVIDLVEDNIVTNVNYEKVREFNHPTGTSRYPKIKTAKGRINSELTYGNDAWRVLFECFVGQRVTLTDYAFARSYEAWNIVTGMLEENIDDSQTSFNITEYKDGEFDNIDGIIIGNEYIAITGISNGAVSGSARSSEGTTATSHYKYDLVYGVIISGGKTVDIISRYRDGFCYSLPTSITGIMYRTGDYFKFNGGQFSDFVFRASPAEGTIESSMYFIGINSDVISLSSPSEATDDYGLIGFEDINCYCMNEWLDVEKIYFQISNTITQSSYKYFDTTYGANLLRTFSSYGQFSLVEESLEAYNSYINDDIKNISITICDSRSFDKAYVFAFNDARYGTMLHILRGSKLITDSVPFYSYGPEKFTVLIQS